MLRAIKVRLYPNKAQEQELNKVIGAYRFVYNQTLARKQEAYNANKTNLGLTKLSKWFHHDLLKDEQYHWLTEQNTKVMNQAIRQMDVAYQNFFKLKNGFPKFKSKKDKQSALFTNEAISKRNTFETRHISLIKSLKNIKFRCSDLYLERLRTYKEHIRSATLSKTKSGDFFLSILMELPQDEFIKFGKTGRKIGIDLGVKDFIITSDIKVGEKVKVKFIPLYFCHLNKFDHGITKRTAEDYNKLNEFFVRANLVSKLCDKLNVSDSEEIIMDFNKFFVIRNLIVAELYNEDRV